MSTLLIMLMFGNSALLAVLIGGLQQQQRRNHAQLKAWLEHHNGQIRSVNDRLDSVATHVHTRIDKLGGERL
jgi:hypothetical protein